VGTMFGVVSMRRWSMSAPRRRGGTRRGATART
jgi:hypothetical protein